MSVPVTLLRKIYRKGSLRNMDLNNDGKAEAFTFSIKNNLASVNALGPPVIKADGIEYPPSTVIMKVEGQVIKGADIAREKPFPIKVGPQITIIIKKESGLSLGEHTIEISVDTKEAGKISFDVKDELK